MEMRPANSMQGFLSVSLRVPSTDPLPLEPLDDAPTRTPREHHLPVTPPETTHPHNFDTLEEDEEGGSFTLKKQDLSNREERGDRGRAGVNVVLTVDYRTNLSHVVNANSREDDCNIITRDRSLDINYEEFPLPERSVGSTGKKVGEHGYAVLEDKKLSIKEDGYSTMQSGYDVPWVTHFPLPGRRVTHTSNVTHSTDKDKTSDIFDDPAYSTSSGTFSLSSGANKPGTPPSHPLTRALTASSKNDPATP